MLCWPCELLGRPQSSRRLFGGSQVKLIRQDGICGLMTCTGVPQARAEGLLQGPAGVTARFLQQLVMRPLCKGAALSISPIPIYLLLVLHTLAFSALAATADRHSFLYPPHPPLYSSLVLSATYKPPSNPGYCYCAVDRLRATCTSAHLQTPR